MANTVVQQINAEMEELQKQLSQFKSSVEYLNNAKTNVTKAVDAVHKAEENFNQRAEELMGAYHSLLRLGDAVGGLIQKIDTVNFPERLDNIQSTIGGTFRILNEVKDATINEVRKAADAITKADFEGKFSNLQNEIDSSVKSNQAISDRLENMKIPERIDAFEITISNRVSEGYKEIEKNTRQIADTTGRAILDLNLPIRIDKLDANIAGILSSIQNVQGRLDLVEGNLKEKMIEAREKQTQSLTAFQEKIVKDLENINHLSIVRHRNQKTLSIVFFVSVIIFLIVLLYLNVSKS